MLPLLRPTRMKSELLGETTMALMGVLVGIFVLMLAQAMLLAVALTLVLRHRLIPPASIVLGLLGSRINGAMKFAGGVQVPPGGGVQVASATLGILLKLCPAFVLRLIANRGFSP